MIEKACIQFMDNVADSGDGTMFQVPFNPAQLYFEAGQGKEERREPGIRGMKVRLKMKLIFDKSLEMGSVQEETERFLEAARDPLKRRVVFQWDELCFDGLLEQMSAVYEMFAEDGKPVRARIDLAVGSRNKSMVSQEWYRDYRDLFSIKG